MTLTGWILLGTTVVVALPALFMLRAKPVPREPTLFCDLPPTNRLGAYAVFALAAPLDRVRPAHAGELFGVTVVPHSDTRVGLVVPPGTFWVYATAVRDGAGVIEAIDSIFASLAAQPPAVFPVATAVSVR